MTALAPRLPGVSVLILTRNEAQDLPGCLRSVIWCDDVHVFDNGSTDATLDIARAAGAQVTQRLTDDSKGIFGGNESEHRTWGLRNIPYKHEWVLQLDADERPTPDLIDNIRRTLAAGTDAAGFRIQRRDFFLGTWLKHVQASPYYLRLFRPERLHYERLINPVPVADGPVETLPGFLDHYPFSKGMSHWLARHNAYSTLEAQQIVANRSVGGGMSLRGAFFEADFHRRRAHQKALFYSLPARPLLKFAILYVAKRGFLDGRAGFTYAVLQAIYEYMIVLKTRELVSASSEPAMPQAASAQPAPSAPGNGG